MKPNERLHSALPPGVSRLLKIQTGRALSDQGYVAERGQEELNSLEPEVQCLFG